jgi:hypothetical protein
MAAAIAFDEFGTDSPDLGRSYSTYSDEFDLFGYKWNSRAHHAAIHPSSQVR